VVRIKVTDWLPIGVIFAAYQLAGWAGRLIARPLQDYTLTLWDSRLFGVMPGLWIERHLPRPALDFFELFYLSYYVLVPLASWLLYARQGRRALWRLWTCVGLSYLICDLLFPFFPSTPPRLVWPDFTGGTLRAVNLFILDRFSVHGNVFPSSHVAAAVAFGLSHLHYHRRRGWFFMLWAAGLTVSTVSGGYHYGVDALGGVAVGVAAEYAGGMLYEWAARIQARENSARMRHNCDNHGRSSGNIAKDWSEESRYEARTQKQAADLYDAIANPTDGVFSMYKAT
jgi:membrane-associated phospholipid phosphatase